MRPTVTSRQRCEPLTGRHRLRPRCRTSRDAGFALSSLVAGEGGAGGGPSLAGVIPAEGTVLPPTPAAVTSRPSSRDFSSLPPSGRGCGGDTCTHPPPPPTSPCSPTDHACTPLPGQDRPSRPSDLRSFLPGCFFTPCTVCTRAAAPPPIPPNPGVGLPSPPPSLHPGVLRPPPPSPPHRPHPTGQVLSLLEIKVHSLWCRGAPAAASCFVSGVRLSPIGDPQALCSPSSSPLPAPSVPAQSPQDPAGQG